ncbi:hypothetical protein D3C77_318320 [compost metagenome]
MQPQHLAPDSGDLLLQRRTRLDVLTAGPYRLRQRFTLNLATRAQGHLHHVHQQRRHHVGWQLLSQCLHQCRGVFHTAVIADQLRTGDGLANQHQRLRHARLV